MNNEMQHAHRSHKVTEQSSSVFFAPVWMEDFEAFCRALVEDCRYFEIEKNNAPQYLLPYITSIYEDRTLYRCFELEAEYLPRVNMLQEKLALAEAPVLTRIRLSCFSTGCAFIELHVTYADLTIDQIANFSARFKNATRAESGTLGDTDMHATLETLMPSGVRHAIFFTGSGFKREFRMLHKLRADVPIDAEDLQHYLIHLRRGYYSSFAPPRGGSDYDMIYEPYVYDRWAGSQEGLVNICFYTEDEAANSFIRNYKQRHLDDNYQFMYLLLLNQRFSAIRYIDQIAALNKSDMKTSEKEHEIGRLNARITRLKTVFAFNVVSDDLLYQNVYKRMYAILDIDRLLEDIRDNEEQEELLHNAKSLDTEKQTSNFLLLLSVLSIASVLIDASSYLDRIPYLESISIGLSLAIVIGILVGYFLPRLRRRRRK